MADLIHDEENENKKVDKKGKSGRSETDGSFGGGQAGAGAGIGFILSTAKSDAVKSEHRHLTAGDLIDAIVEFFSEWPMRASANLAVTWDKTKTNFKSFAIVNWVIEVGAQTVKDFMRTRQLRDTRGLQKQKGPSNNLGLGMGPLGPSGQ